MPPLVDKTQEFSAKAKRYLWSRRFGWVFLILLSACIAALFVAPVEVELWLRILMISCVFIVTVAISVLLTRRLVCPSCNGNVWV
jgi:hypothetical protein